MMILAIDLYKNRTSDLKEKVIVKFNYSFEQRSVKRSTKKKLFTEERNCLLPYTAPKRFIKKLQVSASPLRHQTATLREASATFLLRQTILAFAAIRAHTD